MGIRGSPCSPPSPSCMSPTSSSHKTVECHRTGTKGGAESPRLSRLATDLRRGLSCVRVEVTSIDLSGLLCGSPFSVCSPLSLSAPCGAGKQAHGPETESAKVLLTPVRASIFRERVPVGH